MQISQALCKGIEANGHQVDLVDGDRDVNTRLTGYQYIAVGTSAINTMGGKITESVAKFLTTSGIIAGKRSFAFAIKGGFRIGKTLNKIMTSMEREGMFLKYSEVLSSTTEAEAVGKRLHIE